MKRKRSKTASTLAEHFNAEAKDFRYIHGKGWYFKNARGSEHWVGWGLFEIQCSPNWALKKLEGRAE